MEEPSKRCWIFRWRWKDLRRKQRKKIKEPWPMVLDLAKAFERVSLPVVWAWATLKEDLASAVRVF